MSFERIIKAPRDRVFDVAANYEKFETVLPQFFPSVRVRSKRGDVAVVEQHLRIAGKELVMMTRHVTKRPEQHDTFVIGGDAKGSHIAERYHSLKEETRVCVDADMKLGAVSQLAGLLGSQSILNGLVCMMDEFAKIAES